VNGRFTELRTTALMTSSFHGHSQVVRELLRRGARVQSVDKQGSTALSYAFGGRSQSVLQVLLYYARLFEQILNLFEQIMKLTICLYI